MSSMRLTFAGAAVAAAVAFAAPTSAQPAAACPDAEHHQLDFWVGDWDVYNAKGMLVAHSLVESVYGCGIRENWMPLKGPVGGSLSIYVPDQKGWEQFWISSLGTRVLFKGSWDSNAKAMVIAGLWPSPGGGGGALTRMTYTRLADGSVRQIGEQSPDNGETWTPSFDFTYRRRSS